MVAQFTIKEASQLQYQALGLQFMYRPEWPLCYRPGCYDYIRRARRRQDLFE